MQYDITALGEVLIDFIPGGFDEKGDPAFIRKAGGAPLNVLATAAKYGARTALIGKVGDDLFGRFLRKTLAENGIKQTGLVTDREHNTTLAFVSLTPDGEREFSFYRRNGADIHLQKHEIKEELIRNAKIFHFGSLSLTETLGRETTAEALKMAKEAGCIISYDPNYRAPLWEGADWAAAIMRRHLSEVDILTASKEEALMLTGGKTIEESIQDLHAFGIRVVLVTDGDKGVTASLNGERRHIPAQRVQAVDTTGAGDIFFGTCLSELIAAGADLNSLTAEEVFRFAEVASKTAAQSTLTKGAIASIPAQKG